jgi:virulence-associated protein VagC
MADQNPSLPPENPSPPPTEGEIKLQNPTVTPEQPPPVVIKRAPTPIEDLPKHPVLLLQMTKSGALTLPKDIRDKLQTNLIAFWEQGNKLILQPMAEEDVPHLDIADKKKKEEGTEGEKKPKGERKKKEGEGTEKKEKVKKVTGPQPEMGKYFVYDFENKDKVQTILESAFYKFLEEPPNIEEGLNRLKFALINYITGKNVNDARLRNTMINFLCDVAEKMNLTEVMDFALEKVLINIGSDFLLEQSLITVIITSTKIKNYENSEAFLGKLLIHVEKYPDNELFAIKQLFTNLVRNILRDKIDLPRKQKMMIREEALKFIRGFKSDPTQTGGKIVEHTPLSTDSALELIELVEKLGLVEESNSMAEELLARLLPEDKDIDKVRAKVRKLEAKPI